MAEEMSIQVEETTETAGGAATASSEEQPLWFGLTGSMWFLIDSVIVLLLAILLRVLS